jgi:hypothetical protein
MPTTALGAWTPRVWALKRERMRVVDAKENNPLEIFAALE